MTDLAATVIDLVDLVHEQLDRVAQLEEPVVDVAVAGDRL